MLILEVTFERVITREGAATVWAFLRFIYSPTSWRGDTIMHTTTCNHRCHNTNQNKYGTNIKRKKLFLMNKFQENVQLGGHFTYLQTICISLSSIFLYKHVLNNQVFFLPEYTKKENKRKIITKKLKKTEIIC